MKVKRMGNARIGPVLFILLLLLPQAFYAEVAPAKVQVVANVPYKTGGLTDYEKERCKLDLYVPAQRAGFPSLVWLYGGGLTAGSKDDKITVAIARTFAGDGIA